MHQQRFIRNCQRSVASLVVAALLSSSSYAGALNLLMFVGPVYPEIWRRALIQGTIESQIEFREGRARNVTITGHEVRSPIRKIENPDLFEEAVKKALIEWKTVKSEDVVINVKVVFRLLQTRSDFPLYRYTLRQDESNLPVEVIVETDLSEVQF